jgi:hypothetical protein
MRTKLSALEAFYLIFGIVCIAATVAFALVESLVERHPYREPNMIVAFSCFGLAIAGGLSLVGAAIVHHAETQAHKKSALNSSGISPSNN